MKPGPCARATKLKAYAQATSVVKINLSTFLHSPTRESREILERSLERHDEIVDRILRLERVTAA
jgi:hypothetical protein